MLPDAWGSSLSGILLAGVASCYCDVWRGCGCFLFEMYLFDKILIIMEYHSNNQYLDWRIHVKSSLLEVAGT